MYSRSPRLCVLAQPQAENSGTFLVIFGKESNIRQFSPLIFALIDYLWAQGALPDKYNTYKEIFNLLTKRLFLVAVNHPMCKRWHHFLPRSARHISFHLLIAAPQHASAMFLFSPSGISPLLAGFYTHCHKSKKYYLGTDIYEVLPRPHRMRMPLILCMTHQGKLAHFSHAWSEIKVAIPNING